MKVKKQRISHYELLVQSCDNAQVGYERALTKEASAKHFVKTASSDSAKSEIKILELEYKKAVLKRKARKASLKIATLRLKMWAKTHDVEEKIYELSDFEQPDENQLITQDKITQDVTKKPSKKSIKTSTKTSKSKPTKAAIETVEAETPAPKKRGRIPKTAVVETVVDTIEAEAPAPKKRGRVPKPKPVETAAVVESEMPMPKKKGKTDAAKSAESAVAQPKAPKGRPKSVKTTETGDDLTIIEGIGPKVSAILEGAGIVNFAQLAGADAMAVKKVLSDNKFRFVNSTVLIEQAQLAADGKMDELNAMKLALKGGRKK